MLTLALSHPEPEYPLAAKVMLRWKQIQGEEEAFLARLVPPLRAGCRNPRTGQANCRSAARPSAIRQFAGTKC
ncbi:MAG: hypothetical protein U1F42_03000 [Candidatus Competibacteraceae bacterium]